jgi:hypothetical protein
MKLVTYRDNTPTLQFQVFHSDNSVVNLTGCSVLMCFKTDQSLPNSQASITKSTALGSVAIIDASNGIFQATLSTADTQGFLDSITLEGDCLIESPSGQVFTIANVTTLEVKANYSRA